MKIQLMAIMLMVTMGVSFSSCKRDDDSLSSSSDKSSLLVGTWVSEYLSGDYDVTETLIFKSDGTGQWNYDYYYEDSNHRADKSRYIFNYTYDTTSKILTITRTTGSIDKFLVKVLTKDRLQLDWADGRGQYDTFDRD